MEFRIEDPPRRRVFFFRLKVAPAFLMRRLGLEFACRKGYI